MVEPMPMGEHESDLPLQDSLGPELMKMLEDFGGVEGDLAGKGTGAVGSTLDSAMYHGLDMYAEDGSGSPLGLEPSSFSAPELASPMAHAPKTPQLARSSSGACGEISPPVSAFGAVAGGSGNGGSKANGKSKAPAAKTPQKPRSIRRARSSLPAAQLQTPRGSDERPSRAGSARMRRATSVTEIPVDVPQLGIGSSPRSCSTGTFAPFSPMIAVETCPEVRRHPHAQ
jgi:hypothetical protein